MRTRHVIALLLVFVAFAAIPVRAEIEPPVTITLIGDPDAVPVPYEIFAASLRFTSTEPITMRHLPLQMDIVYLIMLLFHPFKTSTLLIS